MRGFEEVWQVEGDTTSGWGRVRCRVTFYGEYGTTAGTTGTAVGACGGCSVQRLKLGHIRYVM